MFLSQFVSYEGDDTYLKCARDMAAHKCASNALCGYPVHAIEAHKIGKRVSRGLCTVELSLSGYDNQHITDPMALAIAGSVGLVINYNDLSKIETYSEEAISAIDGGIASKLSVFRGSWQLIIKALGWSHLSQQQKDQLWGLVVSLGLDQEFQGRVEAMTARVMEEGRLLSDDDECYDETEMEAHSTAVKSLAEEWASTTKAILAADGLDGSWTSPKKTDIVVGEPFSFDP